MSTRKIIGGFRVLQELQAGSGSQGTVYKAVCETARDGIAAVGDVVALKVMAVQDDGQSLWRRLEQRTQELVRLNHPNVVRYKGCFVETGAFADIHVVVQEFLDGETLKDCLARNPGGLDVDLGLDIVKAALDGLIYTSGCGIVHRDLKPGNIFLCRDGSVKLIDFEIARQAGGAASTATGNIRGSFDYMAPDFINATFHGDVQSDVFSMGVVMHEVLTGKTPYQRFDGDRKQANFAFLSRWSHAPQDGDSPIHVSSRVKRLLANAEEVISKALSPDRAERYVDFASFKEAIKTIRYRDLRNGANSYRLLQYIGKGGFGEVFKARFRQTKELVAVKHLLKAAYAERFFREAKIMQKLQRLHDSCFVRFMDFFVSERPGGRDAFLVMAFLDGMPGNSLRDAIRNAASAEEGHLNRMDVLLAFRRYAHGLQAMHAQGIFHRDIKPSNLYYPTGHPELAAIMDLGIARDVNGTATTGQVPGTLDYMPPEVVVSDSRGDSGMDIYALGLCLYEALTGKMGYPRLPTGTAAYTAFFSRARQNKPPTFDSPSVANDTRLLELLLSMTCPDASKRLKDVGKVIEAIDALIKDGGGQVDVVETVEPPQEDAPTETLILDTFTGTLTGTLTGTAATTPLEENLEEAVEKERRHLKRKRLASVGGVLLLVALAIGGGIALLNMLREDGKVDPVAGTFGQDTNVVVDVDVPGPNPQDERKPVGYARFALADGIICRVNDKEVTNADEQIPLEAGINECQYFNYEEYDGGKRKYNPRHVKFTVPTNGIVRVEIPVDWQPTPEYREYQMTNKLANADKVIPQASTNKVVPVNVQTQPTNELPVLPNQEPSVSAATNNMPNSPSSVEPDANVDDEVMRLRKMLEKLTNETDKVTIALPKLPDDVQCFVNGLEQTAPLKQKEGDSVAYAFARRGYAYKGNTNYVVTGAKDQRLPGPTDADWELLPVQVWVPRSEGVSYFIDGHEVPGGSVVTNLPGFKLNCTYRKVGYEEVKRVYELTFDKYQDLPTPTPDEWKQLQVKVAIPKMPEGVTCLIGGKPVAGTISRKPGERITLAYRRNGYKDIEWSYLVTPAGEQNIPVPTEADWSMLLVSVSVPKLTEGVSCWVNGQRVEGFLSRRSGENVSCVYRKNGYKDVQKTYAVTTVDKQQLPEPKASEWVLNPASVYVPRLMSGVSCWIGDREIPGGGAVTNMPGAKIACTYRRKGYKDIGKTYEVALADGQDQVLPSPRFDEWEVLPVTVKVPKLPEGVSCLVDGKPQDGNMSRKPGETVAITYRRRGYADMPLSYLVTTDAEQEIPLPADSRWSMLAVKVSVTGLPDGVTCLVNGMLVTGDLSLRPGEKVACVYRKNGYKDVQSVYEVTAEAVQSLPVPKSSDWELLPVQVWVPRLMAGVTCWINGSEMPGGGTVTNMPGSEVACTYRRKGYKDVEKTYKVILADYQEFPTPSPVEWEPLPVDVPIPKLPEGVSCLIDGKPATGSVSRKPGERIDVTYRRKGYADVKRSTLVSMDGSHSLPVPSAADWILIPVKVSVPELDDGVTCWVDGRQVTGVLSMRPHAKVGCVYRRDGYEEVKKTYEVTFDAEQRLPAPTAGEWRALSISVSVPRQPGVTCQIDGIAISGDKVSLKKGEHSCRYDRVDYEPQDIRFMVGDGSAEVPPPGPWSPTVELRSLEDAEKAANRKEWKEVERLLELASVNGPEAVARRGQVKRKLDAWNEQERKKEQARIEQAKRQAKMAQVVADARMWFEQENWKDAVRYFADAKAGGYELSDADKEMVEEAYENARQDLKAKRDRARRDRDIGRPGGFDNETLDNEERNLRGWYNALKPPTLSNP